jgi:hypothetical protein
MLSTLRARLKPPTAATQLVDVEDHQGPERQGEQERGEDAEDAEQVRIELIEDEPVLPLVVIIERGRERQDDVGAHPESDQHAQDDRRE